MIWSILLKVLIYGTCFTVMYLYGYYKGYQYSKWEDEYNKFIEMKGKK